MKYPGLKFYHLSLSGVILRLFLFVFRDSGELSLSDLTMTSNLALKTLRKCSVKIGKERMKQRRGSKSEEEEEEEKNTEKSEEEDGDEKKTEKSQEEKDNEENTERSEEDNEKNTEKPEEEEDKEKKTNMSSSEKSYLELPDPEASTPSVAGTPDND